MKISRSDMLDAIELPLALQAPFMASRNDMNYDTIFKIKLVDLIEIIQLIQTLQRKVKQTEANNEHLICHSGRVEMGDLDRPHF